MATLLELAQMSSASYEPAATGSWLKLENDYWAIINQFSNPDTHYYGVAYRNTRTGEIVIANRGTDLFHGAEGAGKDLWSDIQLAAYQGFDAQRDAMIFAVQVAKNNPGATIIETGHSLGGNEAAAAYAALCRAGYTTQVSAVTFQAPGIPSDIAAGAGNDVLNIYNQGDMIRLSGGEHLGTSISIDAGPSAVMTFLSIIAGATAVGRLAATFFGAKLVLDNAHSIEPRQWCE